MKRKRTISVYELEDLFVETIESCGVHLLDEDDVIIGYSIFEDFETGAVSFLYHTSLERLKQAGLINDEIMVKSLELRKLYLSIESTGICNVEGVRTSPKWRKILELSDEIKELYYAEKRSRIIEKIDE